MAARKGGVKGKGTKDDHHDHHDHQHDYLEKMEEQLDEQELEHLYAWVDSIPLSRPKKNISRDFSDGVLVAEIIHHFFPTLVEMHNYSAANATGKKQLNWEVLNRKVFPKMNFELAEDVINDLCCCKPGMIEKVLLMLQVKIKRAEYARHRQNDKPEVDQHHSMSPGRKDDAKGSRFQKTKHMDEYGHMITHRYLENKGWNSGVEQSLPRHRHKMPLVETDVVPRVLLEEREQEILAKDELTKILQAKISRLEHLLHLKDMRIDDLQNRVEATRPTGIRR